RAYTIISTDAAPDIQSTVQAAWNASLAMPCTATDANGICTETTYDPAYVATITVEPATYNLTASSTHYALKLQGTADSSWGCGPTCTCPTGEPACDLSAVTGCASQCYLRKDRDQVVPAKVVFRSGVANSRATFSISGGGAVAFSGGPDAASQVQATFEDIEFKATTTNNGISASYASDTTVRRCRFVSVKWGVDMPSTATSGSTYTVIDSEFTKSLFAISMQKAGNIARVKTENGRGSQVWGNTRGCVVWGSGHVTFEGPLMCYLQGGSSTAFSSSAMGVYTQLSGGTGGINVSTATLDSATGAITNAGTATEGLDPDTGQPFFQIMGTGSSSGTQYLFQFGLFADKTAFIALRNTAISSLGTGICQNMASGTNPVKWVTAANLKITNYKTMWYRGAGNAYCVSPDLSATPQLANTNATTTASPTQFNPSSGICTTSDWKAPTALTPNYRTPALPNPYPSDTSGASNPPGGRCTTSSVCANSGSCCPATGTQTCSTGGDSATTIANGICMCLGINVACDADSQCCNGYCHPTYKQCTCAADGAACSSNAQCCNGTCATGSCAVPTSTPSPP
ncbi:MAG: hypothetical protein ACKOWF_01735, partial [Chloroflexota bacterium]